MGEYPLNTILTSTTSPLPPPPPSSNPLRPSGCSVSLEAVPGWAFWGMGGVEDTVVRHRYEPLWTGLHLVRHRIQLHRSGEDASAPSCNKHHGRGMTRLDTDLVSDKATGQIFISQHYASQRFTNWQQKGISRHQTIQHLSLGRTVNFRRFRLPLSDHFNWSKSSTTGIFLPKKILL